MPSVVIFIRSSRLVLSRIYTLMVPPQIGGYGSMIPLPRRGGGGVERGGDACIALGGRTLPRPGRCKHPRPTSAPPPPLRDGMRLKTLYTGIHKKPTLARSMIPLPRRGGDACIALGGAVCAFHPRFVVEPGTNSDWTFLVFCGVLIYTHRYLMVLT